MNSRDNIDRRIDKLLQGAIDPHVHSGPSIAPRALDHVELLRQASAAGFAAVVTKDHDYSSVMTAALIRKNFPELKTKIYASIVLNNVIGGFNPYAVEHTAAMGGKIVWLPTLAAENHLRWQAQAKWTHPASTDKIRPAVGIPVLDADKNGARRRQGGARRCRQERHGAGERPLARQRDLDRLRGSQAARREAPRVHPSGRYRRRQHERREGDRRHGRLCRALAVHVPRRLEVQDRRLARTCASTSRRPASIRPCSARTSARSAP